MASVWMFTSRKGTCGLHDIATKVCVHEEGGCLIRVSKSEACAMVKSVKGVADLGDQDPGETRVVHPIKHSR